MWVAGANLGLRTVALRDDGVIIDLPLLALTLSDPFDMTGVAAKVRGHAGGQPGRRGRRYRRVLRPGPRRRAVSGASDLQAVKAAGVTFADSLVERVIEAKGDPAAAARVRADLAGALGADIIGVKPGSEEAAKVKAVPARGRGAVVAISGGRHRARRRGVHQGPADVGGRGGRTDRPASQVGLEQPRA